MHVYEEVLTVSACNGTDICGVAHNGFIYRSICDLKKCILVSICAHKQVLAVSARKGIDICEFPHRGFLYKSVHYTKKI